MEQLSVVPVFVASSNLAISPLIAGISLNSLYLILVFSPRIKRSGLALNLYTSSIVKPTRFTPLTSTWNRILCSYSTSRGVSLDRGGLLRWAVSAVSAVLLLKLEIVDWRPSGFVSAAINRN